MGSRTAIRSLAACFGLAAMASLPAVSLAGAGPAQIRAAYDIPRSLTGAGRTVVIIDAFRDPTIRTDVAEFDSTFGLPRVALNIICPGRHCPTFDPTSIDQVGWTNETSLDIEWVHGRS